MIDPRALARELHVARASKASVTTPTSREGGLDLATAYATEAELVRLRQESGRKAMVLLMSPPSSEATLPPHGELDAV